MAWVGLGRLAVHDRAAASWQSDWAGEPERSDGGRTYPLLTEHTNLKKGLIYFQCRLTG